MEPRDRVLVEIACLRALWEDQQNVRAQQDLAYRTGIKLLTLAEIVRDCEWHDAAIRDREA